MFARRKSVWLFLLPGLTGLTIFYLIPFVGGIWYSLSDGSFENAFVGLENYRRIWQNEMFLLGLRNTMELSLTCAPLVWGMSLMICVMLRRWKGKYGFFRSAVLAPYFLPGSAILLIWLVMFDYGGMINRLLDVFGIGRMLWLDGMMLRVPVVLMYLWKNLGFSMVIFTAAIEAIPEELYEYAALEGADFGQQTFRITLPLVAPTAFLALVMAWINALKIFKEIYFIGGAYPDSAVYTLQHYMNNMFTRMNYQYVTSAAYSFAVIVFMLFGELYLIERRMRISMMEER